MIFRFSVLARLGLPRSKTESLSRVGAAPAVWTSTTVAWGFSLDIAPIALTPACSECEGAVARGGVSSAGNVPRPNACQCS
ncbi:hypothetical protein GCM10018952_24160 [Streptosporangium vulgare]